MSAIREIAIKFYELIIIGAAAAAAEFFSFLTYARTNKRENSNLI